MDPLWLQLDSKQFSILKDPSLHSHFRKHTYYHTQTVSFSQQYNLDDERLLSETFCCACVSLVGCVSDEVRPSCDEVTVDVLPVSASCPLLTS